MATVNFKVTTTGEGAGIGVFIKVGGNLLHFPTSGTESMELTPQYYVATISGAEPSDITVTVDIIENGSVLKSAKFSQTTFWGLMAFKVS